MAAVSPGSLQKTSGNIWYWWQHWIVVPGLGVILRYHLDFSKKLTEWIYLAILTPSRIFKSPYSHRDLYATVHHSPVTNERRWTKCSSNDEWLDKGRYFHWMEFEPLKRNGVQILARTLNLRGVKESRRGGVQTTYYMIPCIRDIHNRQTHKTESRLVIARARECLPIGQGFLFGWWKVIWSY